MNENNSLQPKSVYPVNAKPLPSLVLDVIFNAEVLVTMLEMSWAGRYVPAGKGLIAVIWVPAN